MPLIFTSSYDSNNTAKLDSHRKSMHRRSTHSPLSLSNGASGGRNLHSSQDFTDTIPSRNTQSRSNGIRVSHRQPAPLSNKNDNQLNNTTSNSHSSSGSRGVEKETTTTTTIQTSKSTSTFSLSSLSKIRRSGSVNAQNQSTLNGHTSSTLTKGKSSSVKIKSKSSRQQQQQQQQQSQQQQQQQQQASDDANNLNLINPNSANFVESILQSYYQDTYLNAAALSATLNVSQTQSQQSQLLASLSVLSLISQYDNSDNCLCYMCHSNTNDKQNLQINNYEIIPSHTSNNDFSIMRFSYSKPFSQLSCLKLFNLMNTDCPIYYCNDYKPNEKVDIADSKSNVDESMMSNNSNNQLDTPSLLNFTTLPINTQQINSEYRSSNVNNSGSGSNNINKFCHNGKPPIFDTHYLYLIDCRLDRKEFESSHINTAIYYEDLLKDHVYLSPPVEHYTIVVLYDEDGTYLTSNEDYVKYDRQLSSRKHQNNHHLQQQQQQHKQSSDTLISTIKQKLNHIGTLYILSGGYEQFRSCYPYMCSNLDIRSTVDRYKYLTIYPNCVLENFLFLGTGAQAKNWKIIRDLRITHIINCSIEHECMFQDTIKYLHIKLEDSLEENIYRDLDRSYEFIEDAINTYINDNSAKYPPKILIHCNLGISRSSSIVIAFLIRKYKLCLYSTFNYVRDKRLQIAPNYSFLKQLKYYENNI